VGGEGEGGKGGGATYVASFCTLSFFMFLATRTTIADLP
jgi:hypothetical protein